MLRELEPLTSSIYIFPRDETPNTIQPNIGVIALEKQTVLIDAGNSPRHARRIIAAVSNRLLPPIGTIILTHHHWDHTFGMNSFNPQIIVAHDHCATALTDLAQREWSAAALRQEIAENPNSEISNNAIIDAIPDWRDFQIIQPNMTFSKTLSLYLEDMRIDLEYVGGRHAIDSILVKIPQEHVMFLGDCYYPEPYHLRSDGDEDLNLPMLEACLKADYDIYVDGHGPPRTHAEFAKMIAWEKGRQGVTD